MLRRVQYQNREDNQWVIKMGKWGSTVCLTLPQWRQEGEGGRAQRRLSQQYPWSGKWSECKESRRYTRQRSDGGWKTPVAQKGRAKRWKYRPVGWRYKPPAVHTGSCNNWLEQIILVITFKWFLSLCTNVPTIFKKAIFAFVWINFFTFALPYVFNITRRDSVSLLNLLHC